MLSNGHLIFEVIGEFREFVWVLPVARVDGGDFINDGPLTFGRYDLLEIEVPEE